jgi:mannose-6-phosphate isomerase-like protein (cupin superfamily)
MKRDVPKMLAAGEGARIAGGGIDVSVKATMEESAFASTFEVIVPPKYDVGAHVHAEGNEIFYVVKGHLDILAFEPADRSIPDWHEWVSADGRRYLRGGPGAFMYVPVGVPHAFGNPTDEPAVLFFQSTVGAGHENYFRELKELLTSGSGRPPEAEILRLRKKYHIQQLTGMFVNH